MKKSLTQFKRWLFGILLVLAAQAGYAQVNVSGVVSDDLDQTALVGVSVTVKGTTKGTVTDAKGKYALSVPNNATLVFSFTGFDAKTVEVGNRNIINVSLKMSDNILSEVVVVGYGTQKEKEVTGAVATIKADMIVKSPVSDLGAAIQGQIAGVNVQASSGRPGDNSNVQIRGLGSLSSGALEPLYVVDGVPYQSNPNIAPEQIGSIDVLKDGAAASVYGTRASNGVILITTKRGEKGKMKVGLNAYYGVQNITSGTPLMDTPQQMYFEQIRSTAIGVKPNIFLFNPNALDFNSNFVKDVQNNNAPIQSYNLSVSGGQNDITLAVNTNYFKQDGILINSGFDRLSNRITGEFKRGKFKAFTSVGYTIENKQQEPWALYEFAILQKPYQSPLGDVSLNGSKVSLDVENPITFGYLSRELQSTNITKSTSSSIAVNLSYEILKGLKAQVNLGRNTWDSRGKAFQPQYLVYNNAGVLNPTASRLQAVLNENLFFTDRSTLENVLTYYKELGKHKLNFTGVLSYEAYNSKQIGIGVNGTLNNNTQTLGAGITGLKPTSYDYSNSLTGKLVRAQYNYGDRYLFSASIRRDGSSNFGPENRYGTFYGLSAGWNVTEEEFFKQLNISAISNLKIRASYAGVGNQSIPPYSYADLIEAGVNYPFGATEDLSTGTIQRRYGNPFVQWETNISKNIGLNLDLFGGKLNFVADYYESNKSDMLLPEKLAPSTGTTQPGTGGLYDTRITNAGNMTNKGLELSFNFRNQTKYGLKYTAGLTFTRNRNTITNLNGLERGYGSGYPTLYLAERRDATTFLALNNPAGAFFLVENMGVAKTQEQLDAYKKIDPSAQLGDLMFKDQNGDNKIDDNDRVYKGSGQAKFESGFNTNLNYKNFDLFVQLYGSYGSKIYNGPKMFAYSVGRHEDLYYQWSPQNPDSDIPTNRTNELHNNVRSRSDFFLEDGSYLRIRNLTFGYTIPKADWNKKIERMRFYVSAMNLLTFTKYTGYNPEIGGDGLFYRGVDRGNYPVSRRFIGGLQFDF
jgi:TonB-dependent starch-binding outer membrane protein SusC